MPAWGGAVLVTRWMEGLSAEGGECDNTWDRQMWVGLFDVCDLCYGVVWCGVVLHMHWIVDVWDCMALDRKWN